MGPIDSALRAEGRAPPFELLAKLRMDGESLGPAQELLVERHQERGCQRRVHLLARSGQFVLVLRGDHSAHARLEALLDVDQALVCPGGLLFGLLRGQHPGLDERPYVELSHGRQALDPLVHHRLRVGRLVALVVTVAPVADQVDEDVLVELVAIRHREPHRRKARFGVIGVDVNDRDVESLG
jgi:hypothetical protein